MKAHTAILIYTVAMLAAIGLAWYATFVYGSPLAGMALLTLLVVRHMWYVVKQILRAYKLKHSWLTLVAKLRGWEMPQ